MNGKEPHSRVPKHTCVNPAGVLQYCFFSAKMCGGNISFHCVRPMDSAEICVGLMPGLCSAGEGTSVLVNALLRRTRRLSHRAI
jgi:hypothetical protein